MRKTAKEPNTHEIRGRIADIYARSQFAQGEDYLALLEEGLTLTRQLPDAPICICNECRIVCEELECDLLRLLDSLPAGKQCTNRKIGFAPYKN